MYGEITRATRVWFRNGGNHLKVSFGLARLHRVGMILILWQPNLSFADVVCWDDEGMRGFHPPYGSLTIRRYRLIYRHDTAMGEVVVLDVFGPGMD